MRLRNVPRHSPVRPGQPSTAPRSSPIGRSDSTSSSSSSAEDVVVDGGGGGGGGKVPAQCRSPSSHVTRARSVGRTYARPGTRDATNEYNKRKNSIKSAISEAFITRQYSVIYTRVQCDHPYYTHRSVRSARVRCHGPQGRDETAVDQRQPRLQFGSRRRAQDLRLPELGKGKVRGLDFLCAGETR